jgi:23S rRNA (pseudouridine1915-N3)-methyltransferase
MKINILALGHKMPTWVTTGVTEYQKRMPSEARIDIIELKPEDRANRSVEKVLSLEASRIEEAIPKNATRIICDERGQLLTTPQLAAWLKTWMAEGLNPCFVIGSADGLAPSIKKTASYTVALSGCVLPHGMVRVLLVEQLYRAWSLLHNHPYHRE